MISVDQIVDRHLPRLQRHPWLSKSVRGVLRRLLHEQNFHAFARQYPHLEGFPFVEQVLEHFAFSYAVRDNERERIPRVDAWSSLPTIRSARSTGWRC